MKQPLVITGVTSKWRKGPDKGAKAFSKAALLERHSKSDVKVGLSKHIPRNSGDGYEQMTLEEMMKDMSAAPIIDSDPV